MNPINNIQQKLVHSGTAQKLITVSKSTRIPGFKNVYLYDVLVRFREQIIADNIIERASAIAYNFAMALPPMIIFLFTLIPFLPISKAFINEIYRLIHDIVPGPRNYLRIIEFLNDFLNNPRNGLLSVGFVLSVFFSSNAVMGIMRSFDKDLPGFIKRKGLRKRWSAIKITITILLLFFLCLALIIAQGAVLRWMGIENPIVRYIISRARWIFVILLFFAINSYIYRYTPSIDKRWKMITPGSVIATVIMLMVALGFSWWVSNFGNYNKLYGSIGTILIIMVLIYLNSLILLIGFEMNVSIHALAKAHQDLTPPISVNTEN